MKVLAPKPTFTITLVALPRPVEDTLRLRGLLKLALRRFGFRCVRIERLTGVINPPPVKARAL